MKKLLIIIPFLFFIGPANAAEGRLCHHLDRFIKHGQMISEDKLQDILDMREHSEESPEAIKKHEKYLERLQAHVFLVQIIHKERGCEK